MKFLVISVQIMFVDVHHATLEVIVRLVGDDLLCSFVVLLDLYFQNVHMQNNANKFVERQKKR